MKYQREQDNIAFGRDRIDITFFHAILYLPLTCLIGSLFFSETLTAFRFMIIFPTFIVAASILVAQLKEIWEWRNERINKSNVR